MKVMVTGAAGFIGNHIVERFKKAGCTIVGMDMLPVSTSYTCYVKNMIIDDLQEVLYEEKPDLIIHCAGLANVSYSLEHVEEDFDSNTIVVYRLLEAMRKSELSTSRFVLLSSAAVYGQPERLPIKETDDLHPMSPYALHKKLAEDICFYYKDNYNFDIRILRIFSAYGPGLKKQIFWDMYQKVREKGTLELLGTGRESRDYIYIDDLIEAIYLIAVEVETMHTVWNVASGQEVSIKDVAYVVAQKMNIDLGAVQFTGRVREGDPINWCADVSRLKEIGYVSKTNIEDGVEKYLDWVKDV